MITHLAISNYRSLGESTELTLGPLTALVGPNGSGKSNIVDALRFLSDAIRNGLEAAIAKRQGITALRRWSSGRPFNITISVTLTARDGGSGGYVIELGATKEAYRVKREFAEWSGEWPWAFFEVRNGRWISGPRELKPKIDPMSLALPLIAADFRFRPLANAIRDVAVYLIFPDTLRRPQTYDPIRPMDEHGTNWCSILKDARHNDWVGELRASLGQITSDIDDIKVTTAGGFLIPEFRHGVTSQKGKARERWFAAAQESDGTLRMAGIITALLQEPPLTLIGIEEPELTVHPGMLPLLYDFLVQASQRSQALITTHSPDLLGLLKADEVRVVERHDGVTTVGPMDESQRAAVQERLFTPGELMRWEGLRQAPAGHGQMVESPLT